MHSLIRFMTVILLVLGTILVTPASPVLAAVTFSVNTTLDLPDVAPGNGQCRTALSNCSLRAAIMESNALAGVDIIHVSAITYTLSFDGNPSPDNDDTSASGDLDITDSVVIRVNGSGQAVISGNGSWSERIMENLASTGKGLLLDHITLSNGNSAESGGGFLNSGLASFRDVVITNNHSSNSGGGVHNMEQLNISGGTISNNSAYTNGGGIHNEGALTLTLSTVNDNSAGGTTLGGGGIFNEGADDIIITESTIRDNTASNGGGIYMRWSGLNPRVDIIRSTLNGNIASTDGGGLYVGGGVSVNLVNSTVSNNQANNDGGGIYAKGSPSVASSTIAQNRADADANGAGNGGGIRANASGTNFQLMNTMVSENIDSSPGSNPKHADCTGQLNSSGYILIQSITGCTIVGDTTGNILGVFPNLSALQDNGGPTFTHFTINWIGVDGGNPTGCTDFDGILLATDQRGGGRHQGSAGGPGRCDIGSYEFVQPA